MDTDADPPLATLTRIQRWNSRQQATLAPMTPAQRRAVWDLDAAIAQAEADEKARAAAVASNAAGAPVELDLGDENWVDILHKYRAAHPTDPTGAPSTLVFVEDGVEGPGGPKAPQRWTCAVRIHESAAALGGGEAGAPATTFGRKKDARTYACKCAVEFLRREGHMPADGSGRVRFAKPASEQQQQQQQQQASKKKKAKTGGAGDEVNGNNNSGSSKKKSAAASATTGSSEDDLDEDQMAVHQVAELCKCLGIQAPRYRLEEDPEQPGFWQGSPTPDPALSRYIPGGCGRVTGVYGKRNAREVLADALLPHLRAEWERRQEAVRMVLGELAAANKKSGGGQIHSQKLEQHQRDGDAMVLGE